MKMSDLLKLLRDRNFCPFSAEHAGRVNGKFVLPSNSELRRWCEKGSVCVDGVKMGWQSSIPDEAVCLQFFRGSPSQCTMPLPWGLITETQGVKDGEEKN